MKQNLRFLMLTLLCAVFSTAWGGEVTFVAGTDKGSMNGTDASNQGPDAVTKNGITISTTNGAFAAAQYRVYKDASFTISSTAGNITKIEMTFTTSGTQNNGPSKISGTGYTYSENIGTWEGTAASITLSATAQARMTQIVVTFEGSGQTGPVDPVINPISDMSLKVGGTKDFKVGSTSNGAISVSSGNTEVATVSGSDTNWTVTAVGVGTTTITINQEAVTDKFNAGTASFVVTVTEATIPVNALLYESFSGYEGGESSTAFTTTSNYLDYDNWSDIKYAYPGGSDNDHGGYAKFSSSKNNGSMTTGTINLSGNGELTFWLKKYGTDNGSMSVTVTGATVTGTTSFVANDSWTKCTVDLEEANGNVVITFSATKRVYLDEIQLIAVSTNKVAKPTFSSNGGTYTTAQSVTISCATEGATIYYTTNGDEPTTSSTVYNNNNPVSITTTGTTLKAIAVLDGMENSNIAESGLFIIQPEAPVISEQNGEIVITAANGLTIYYTAGENPADPTNASMEYSMPIPFTTTVTVKAIAYDAYDNPSAVNTKTFEFTNIRPNPKNINSGYYVKVTDASELEAGDAILFVSEDDALAMSTTQNTNNRGAAEVTLGSGFIVDPSEDVQKVILTVDPDEQPGVWYFYVDNGYLYAASSSSNWLRTEDNPDENAKATISISNGDATIQFQGTNERNILKYNPNTNGNPLFSCYGKNSSNEATTQIYKEVEAQTETVNIGSTKYATLYYSNENLIVPANVTAMTYKASGEKIAVSKTYATGEVIPKGTAVVLEGTAAGAYNFIVTTADGEGDSESDLYGLDVAGTTPAPGEGEYYYYKLSKASKDAADTTVGFYFGATDGGQFALTGPHRAYLAIPKPQNGTGVSAFVFDETVGISQIKNVTSDDSIYTLSGVKVSNDNLSKGIYIVNGKKIVIK